ncbi:ADP-ribosylglycohydrolase family protein [uncultured Ruegeria sp.]|uniref:ADP-ribosylglycohydrolase family protein n=1 Tax=uncultured Ruegeria sp. TaxID=259304 RepID=UPI0026370F32|nr:ADP-ribosylglycohydrolase family protein [uncultured Ruegeria sp.]
MTASAIAYDRACGALAGMAIGDALGMPSQTLSRPEIERHYGEITAYVAPFTDHPVSHGLQAAQVTDDTEQAFLLARRLVKDGKGFNEALWAQDLLDWERDVRDRGLRDLLGPSSKAALAAMLNGEPASETGRNGTTNGAAMRIAPVGIATRFAPTQDFLDRVELACRMTHNTGEAIAAAAAVAAVVSCGVDGLDFDAALDTALNATEQGQKRGHQFGEANMRRRISNALDLIDQGLTEVEFAQAVGTSVSSFESVPAAFGIVRMASGDVWKAARIAANIGDDTDTIGAIAGAMAGACTGIEAIAPAALDPVRTTNNLPIEAIAEQLLSLRSLSGTMTGAVK